jgi:Fe-S cluster assembly protein SufD
MTQAPTKYARYLDDFDANAAGLAAQPEWLRTLRKQAIDHFREVGLPTARKGNEPWKYTNVAPIAGAEFAYGLTPSREPSVEELTAAGPWCTVWHEVAFVNGRYSPALSESPATHEPREGLGAAIVGRLTDAIVSHPEIVRKHLGAYAPFDYDGFSALNTAFLNDGAFIYVPDGANVTTHLHIVYATSRAERAAVSYPRTLVVAGRDSNVTVVESYISLDGGGYFNDAVTEIGLDEGARVAHYRVLLDRNAYHVGVTRVRQGNDSHFTTTTFETGTALARNDFSVLLDGEGAECHMRGLYVTAGEQHVDNYLTIDHAKPHGLSRLYYKGILDEKSKAVFGGTVFVRPGAIKTNAHQEDKNLVLSHEAEVDSKPALEIYADDVLCGHGATAGALAEDALFYMQSRGIDEATANQLLIRGFASEILDGVMEPLREYLEKETSSALPRFRQAEVTA